MGSVDRDLVAFYLAARVFGRTTKTTDYKFIEERSEGERLPRDVVADRLAALRAGLDIDQLEATVAAYDARLRAALAVRGLPAYGLGHPDAYDARTVHDYYCDAAEFRVYLDMKAIVMDDADPVFAAVRPRTGVDTGRELIGA